MPQFTVVVTDSDHDKNIEEETIAARRDIAFRVEHSTPETLVDNISDANGILVQYAHITEEVMRACPKLAVVGRYGVGIDTVDVAAATRLGVAVTNVPDYGTEVVSDHAIALALALGRGLLTLHRNVEAGVVDLPSVRPLHQFRDRVFGVIGMGRIGAATARKAKGLGYEVIGFDTLATPGEDYHGIPAVSLDELLGRSQVVSLHVPLDDSSRHLMDAQRLARMRDDAVIINTARGGVIDTDALVEALRNKTIAGAGLDCHETEPLPADHPLVGLRNVILTPHAAWYSEESYSELKHRTMANVADCLAGRTPRNIVNPEVLGTKNFAARLAGGEL